MTRLVSITTTRCTTIHRAECHTSQRGHAQPWPPGNTRRPEQLAIDAARLGFRPCRVCKPFPMPDPTRMPGYMPPMPVRDFVASAEAQMGVV